MSTEHPWRLELLNKLRQRDREQVMPFRTLFELQRKVAEENVTLATENSSLKFITEKLKDENSQLKARGPQQVDNSENLQELQRKLFSVQEELTELHRRKGENAQQVIDLSALVKVQEKELADRQQRIDALEAEMIGLRQDLTASEAKMSEVESTSQLLKDEYQALQLALTSAESRLRGVQGENEVLVVQLMNLKAQDVDRMNFENEQFIAKQQQQMQIELAEAAKEQKVVTVGPGSAAEQPQSVTCGVVVPSEVGIRFEAHEGEIMSAKWDFTGRYLATAGADRKIKIWDQPGAKMQVRQSPDLKATLTGSNAAVMGIDFDTSGSLILGASNDFATRVWTIEDCRLRHTLTGHSGKVLSARFLGDATRVVSGSHDRTLKVWDLRSKACISTKFAGSSCNDLVTSDQVIISGHFDKKVRLWDNRSSSSEPMTELMVGGKVTSLDLSRDMNLLATCSRDDKIQVLDLRKGGGQVCQVGGGGFHVGCDWSRVSLSPDAEYVTGGAGDGTVHVWSVLRGTSEAVLRSHTSLVSAVAWHPGGCGVVSVDKSKTVVYWT